MMRRRVSVSEVRGTERGQQVDVVSWREGGAAADGQEQREVSRCSARQKQTRHAHKTQPVVWRQSGAELEQEPSRVQRPEGSSAGLALGEACLACGVAEANEQANGCTRQGSTSS